jgi:hypothetical protein
MPPRRKTDGTLTLLGRVGRALGLGRLAYQCFYRPTELLRRLRVPDRSVDVPLFGMKFHMPSPRRAVCFQEIYLHGVWAPAVTQVVRDLVKPGMIVAVVGAGIGYYVLLVASVNPTGRIFAVEPSAECFAVLERNVRENGLSNVRSFQIAAGRREKTTGQERRLDDVLIPDLPPGGRLDFVQIDVGGAERDVICGMEQLLARDRPNLLVALHGPLLPSFGTTKTEFLRWLADRGYESRWIDGEGLDGPGTSHALFTPKPPSSRP